MAGNFQWKQFFCHKDPEWIFFHAEYLYYFKQKQWDSFSSKNKEHLDVIGKGCFKIHNIWMKSTKSLIYYQS